MGDQEENGPKRMLSLFAFLDSEGLLCMQWQSTYDCSIYKACSLLGFRSFMPRHSWSVQKHNPPWTNWLENAIIRYSEKGLVHIRTVKYCSCCTSTFCFFFLSWHLASVRLTGVDTWVILTDTSCTKLCGCWAILVRNGVWFLHACRSWSVLIINEESLCFWQVFYFPIIPSVLGF